MRGGPRTVRGPSKPRSAVRPRRAPPQRELLFLLAVALLFGLAAVLARSGWFTAGSDLGYWIGVAGGAGMVLLLTYPLRKRWRPVRNLGATKSWFALHMMLGIAGPLLIVVHSTLNFGSLNATVAFGSMVLVAASGIVGRFLYGRIHHGLYGRRATLADMRSKLGLDSGLVRSRLAFAPRVEEWLAAFASRAEAAVGDGGFGQPLRLLLLGFEARRVRRACLAEMLRELKLRAANEDWPRQKLVRRARARAMLIRHYVRAVLQVAQFGAWERLFSWWHMLHVPFLYMLVISAIAHVIAVHMY